ncbi:hypothetical protein ILUMI_18587, partial [Ignelater luminosus]
MDKYGLWPPDRHVYTEADFAPALVTDRLLVSGDSSIVEEPPPKQLSEIVTISQLKDYPSTSETSYIQ